MFPPINKQLRRFPSQRFSLSLSSQLSLAPFGRDTQIVTCLSGSAEMRQIETHLAVELEEWWHATSDCVG